jgi:hypothetical protein
MATLQKLLTVMICELLNNADGENMWDTRELEHIHCQNYITSVCWRGLNTTSVDIGQFSAALLIM